MSATKDYCSSSFDFLDVDARAILVEYRITFLIAWCVFFATTSHLVNKHLVKWFAAYSYISHKAREELHIRCMQFSVGTFIAVTGYAFLLFQWITGCDASEIYGFFVGGITLMAYETTEFLQRFPLPPALMTHHAAVMLLGLGIADWQVLLSKEDDKLCWVQVCILANIGATWASDFFHAVYRTSLSLKWIQTCQNIFLFLTIARVANVALILSMTFSPARHGNWAGFCVTSMLTAAYAYITRKAVLFVYRFDAAGYYATHQAKWTKNRLDNKRKRDFMRIPFLAIEGDRVRSSSEDSWESSD